MKKLFILLICGLLTLAPLSVGAATSTTPTTEPSLSTTVKGGVTYYTEKPLTYIIKEGEAVITDTLMGCPVTAIGEEAFYDCAWLTEVTLPDSVRRIGDQAFSLCKELRAITLGKDVEHLGQSVFTDATSLKTITVAAENPHLTVEKGILYSKDKTVLYLAPLGVAEQETFVIPDGVATIHSAAFEGNHYLRCVVMPDSVTTVGNRAFLLCRNLQSVVLSAHLQTIKAYAFWNCDRLTRVFYNGTDAQFTAMVIEKSNQLEDIPWQPIDAATLQGLIAPQSPTTAPTATTPTSVTNPPSSTTTSFATVTQDTASTPTTEATTPPTAAASDDAPSRVTPVKEYLPWLIAGVCAGLLIAVCVVLAVVLYRKKK